MSALEQTHYSKSIDTQYTNSFNTNDVSFSIPEWKHQELQSINQDYEKKIYSAVPLSLTDFNSLDEIQFMTKPQKANDQKFAYVRKLVHAQDFSILAFILCYQQTLLGETDSKPMRIEKFKKKISQLDLCTFEKVPLKVQNHYNNKILKKILFQYINKGSYNVSLLQILLRKNHLLKFALSLVSKTILKTNNLINNFQQKISCYVEMKICGDYFDVLQAIKVKDKSIESENFYICTLSNEIIVNRKQNIIKVNNSKVLDKQKQRSLTPTSSLLRRNSHKKEKRKSKNKEPSQITANQQYFGSKINKKQSKIGLKQGTKRSLSVRNIIKKFICY